MGSEPATTQTAAISNTNQLQEQENNPESSLQSIDNLKFFLATAPSNWKGNQVIRRYYLNNDHGYISCVLWNDIYYITGTDIVKACIYRMQLFGREVTQRKKFEEGIFSDLRNLKCGIDAVLEPAKSDFLRFLFKNMCVKTQKKQKVFFWFNVPHDKLFADALERDLKREALKQPCPTHAVAEPALSFKFNVSSNKSLFEQVANFISTVEKSDDNDKNDDDDEQVVFNETESSVPKGEATDSEQQLQLQIPNTDTTLGTSVMASTLTEVPDYQSTTSTDNVSDLSIHVEYPAEQEEKNRKKQVFDNLVPATPVVGTFMWPYPVPYDPLVTSRSANGELLMAPIVDNNYFPDLLIPEELPHQISAREEINNLQPEKNISFLQKYQEEPPPSTAYEEIPFQQANIYQSYPSPYNNCPYPSYSPVTQSVYPCLGVSSQTPTIEMRKVVPQPQLFDATDTNGIYDFPLIDQQPISPPWNIPFCIEPPQPTLPVAGHLIYTPSLGSKIISPQVSHGGKENVPAQAQKSTNTVGNKIYKRQGRSSSSLKKRLGWCLGTINKTNDWSGVHP